MTLARARELGPNYRVNDGGIGSDISDECGMLGQGYGCVIINVFGTAVDGKSVSARRPLDTPWKPNFLASQLGVY